MKFGTNASNYSSTHARGCVVMGPGSIAQAHQKDEYVEVDQLLKMVHILEAYIFG